MIFLKAANRLKSIHDTVASGLENPGRRKFLKIAAAVGASSSLAAGGVFHSVYVEKYHLSISRTDIPIDGLPPAFDGFKIGLIADMHLSRYLPSKYLYRAVKLANTSGADVFALVGDYVSGGVFRIPKVIDILAGLQAPYGIFAVLGNHDHWTDAAETRTQLEKHGIPDLTNRHTMIERDGSQICLAGVGDLWEDKQRLDLAFNGVPPEMPRVLLSHNPDYAEEMPAGYRVDIMLSGHTHGGQVKLPLIGAPILPSRYGQKYREGLVEGPRCRVFVSRGVGFVRFYRFNCPPEIPLITLRRNT